MHRELLDAISDSRKKTSRHEYHQEQSLMRIEQEVNRLEALHIGAEGVSSEPVIDILFVTSNGAGLGHVSRLLAVADKLDSNSTFEVLTLSLAYRQVADQGVTVHYFPSSEAAAEAPARWNRKFREYFAGMLRERRPRLVVFDGTWVYAGITEMCRVMEVPLVWMQRGMWKQEVDEKSAQRHDVASVADYVIIPGDFAGVEQVDTGPGVQPSYVAPIVRTDRSDLLDRESACLELGLDPARRYVLLNVGGGSVSNPSSIASAAVRQIERLTPHMTAVQVVSPLASPDPDDSRLISVSRYPIMDCAGAFDFIIAAAGYNSAQEAVYLGVPTILVPNVATKTDDQQKRARLLADQDLCLVADDEDGLEDAIRQMSIVARREEIQRNSGGLPAATGAHESADLIRSIMDQNQWINRRLSILSTTEQGD
ncbi:glycosyltransferase [Brevibacterium sp. CT2-23B]|uniref:glycosyltransferase n=1 Tax=Brevibacterium sp. CT2-23B TaxID=2729630 RepID=UPI001556C697|nr:glycosyltransferase [Brevibacterium sp. CT2-23B]